MTLLAREKAFILACLNKDKDIAEPHPIVQSMDNEDIVLSFKPHNSKDLILDLPIDDYDEDVIRLPGEISEVGMCRQ